MIELWSYVKALGRQALVRKEQRKRNVLPFDEESRESAPNVEVLPDRAEALGLPDALILRNASAHFDLHAICVQPRQSSDNLFVSWQPNQVPILKPGQGVTLRPWISTRGESGQPLIIHGLSRLAAEVRGRSSAQGGISLGKFAFTCVHRRNDRYLVSCEITLVWRSNSLNVGPINHTLMPPGIPLSLE
jgi:hypothetical protein